MRAVNLIRSLAAGAVGLALITGLFLLTGVKLADLAQLIAHLNGYAFAGIVACTFGYIYLGGIKWRLISGVPEPRPHFYTHFTAQAMLLGQFLPVPLAIAVNRAAVMKIKQNTALKGGLLNALYDMGFDFLIAVLMLPVSLLQWIYGFDWILWLAALVSLFFIADFFLMQAPGWIPKRWLAKLRLEKERERGLLSARLIGRMMLLSAARFALVIARLMFGAIAIGAPVPLAVIAFATGPVTMSALLMLTPANLGIAEWSWAYVLTLWGVPLAVGTLYAVSFRILLFGAQLIVSGGCWLLYSQAGRR